MDEALLLSCGPSAAPRVPLMLRPLSLGVLHVASAVSLLLGGCGGLSGVAPVSGGESCPSFARDPQLSLREP